MVQSTDPYKKRRDIYISIIIRIDIKPTILTIMGDNLHQEPIENYCNRSPSSPPNRVTFLFHSLKHIYGCYIYSYTTVTYSKSY